MLPPRFDRRNLDLFKLIGTLEAPTARHLHTLFFARAFTPSRCWNPMRQERHKGEGISLRGVQARVRELVRLGYLHGSRFGVHGNRADGYSLAPAGAELVGDDGVTGGLAPTADDCRRAWVRGEIWATVAGSEQITCGQSAEARKALAEVSGNSVELTGVLPFDIVHGQDERGQHAFVIVVDDVRQEPEAQVAALPVHKNGGPTIGVLVRPSDDGSVWVANERRWKAGPRLETLLGLLERTPQYRPWNPRMFREKGILRRARN